MFRWITKLFRRNNRSVQRQSDNTSKTPFASGRSGDQLVFGRCPACGKLLDHTPIQIPVRPPSPNPGHPGDYYVEFTNVCFKCAHIMTGPKSAFENSLMQGDLEPKTLWTNQVFEGKPVVAIEENTSAARKRRYKRK